MAMNGREAFKKDFDFYYEYDEDTDYLGVFGTETGFCYALVYSVEEARRTISQLRRQKNFIELTA